MTRARALKEAIRARAARTGERYTTARRHVLAARAAVAPAAKQPAATAVAPTATRAPKGSLSDARCRQHTGHGLDHWFAVLDRFGAVEKGHTASARHLHETHGVSGWYSQGITVVYERARGLRAVNQRGDGAFEVSVSKVVSGNTSDVINVMTDPRLRRRWLEDADPELAAALIASVAPGSKGVVLRADGLGRHRYKWGDTVVQIYLVPKAGGKVSVVTTNSRLAGTAMVEERRAQWRAALNALASALR